MKIENMGYRYMYGQQRERQERPIVTDKAAGPPESNIPVTQDQEVRPTGQPTDARATGVLRNLEDGHYQGVASLRLQINFHHQIVQTTTADATQMLASSSEAMMVAMEQRVSSIGEDFSETFGETFLSQASALMGVFRDTIHAFFAGEEPQPPQTILTGIDQAFSEFFNNFSVPEPVIVEDPVPDVPQAEEDAAPANLALAADALEASEADMVQENDIAAAIGENDEAAQTSPVESEAAEPLSFTERLGELQAWFTEQFNAMQIGVDELMAPLPLGAPHGRGIAYSRFLSIYNEMNNIAPQGTDSSASPTEGLSTEA